MTAACEEGAVADAPFYEIELDLSTWKAVYTHQVPKFAEDLFRVLPLLKDDTCRSGKVGEFSLELQKGTNFAHVIEHVILALIRLAKGLQGGAYSGWTQRLQQGHSYLIHYSAPDFLTARLAALLSLDLVKRLIAGTRVDCDHAVELLKQPQSYFTEKAITGTIEQSGEPVGVIQALKSDILDSSLQSPKERALSGEQWNVIKKMLKDIRHQMGSIAAAWRESFLAYGGTYGELIADKLELLNIDRFFVSLVGGNLPKVMGELKRAVQLIASYNIPETFVIHSLWLYKNKLLSQVMDKHKYRDTAPVDLFVKDFEELYQIIVRHVREGYVQRQALASAPMGEFKKFIELNPHKGRILVVDDDEMIRRVVGDVLELHGYQIMLAQSGVQALEMLGDGLEGLSLVILDVYRPKDIMVQEVYERINVLCGGVKFIVTSGLSVPRDLDAFLNAESIIFLKKPFTVNFLMSKIESLLG